MFYVIPDTLLKVLVLTPLSTIFQLLCTIWHTVVLVFNDTFNNVLVIAYNMVTSFMFYAIANIVESGVKHQ
jgi:hypothetical protein